MITIERYVVFCVTTYDDAGVFLRIDSAHDDQTAAYDVAARKTAGDFNADYVVVDMALDADGNQA